MLTIKKSFAIGGIFLCLITFHSHAIVTPLAKGTRLSDTSNGNVTITGTVMLPPPCTVNNDGPITIEYGTLFTNKIDGVNYGTKSIPVTISCAEAPTGHLEIMLKGNAAAEDNAVLTTSSPELGLRITRDGEAFNLNTLVNVASNDAFNLSATPTTLQGKTPEAGEFTAAATLVLQQQ